MNRLYETSKTAFSLLWICCYLGIVFVSERLSAWVGIEKSVTAPLLLGMTAFFLHWLRKNAFWHAYGICPCRIGRREAFAPVLFLLLAGVNLLGGISCSLRPWPLLFDVLSMLCVGFLEELLFRGFLTGALRRLGDFSAALFGALLFGAAHFLNIAGSDTAFRVLLLALFAAASGFFFAAFYLRTGALWPCMLTHAALNITAAFSGGNLRPVLVGMAVLSVLCMLCGCLLLRLPKEERAASPRKDVKGA